VSDWGATHDSAAENANAGLDMEQPGDFLFIGEPMVLNTLVYGRLIDFTGGGIFGEGNLKNAVHGGHVTVARLNQMVAHILAPWYHLGQDSVGHFRDFIIRAAQ
jgi:beta-glucosidase